MNLFEVISLVITTLIWIILYTFSLLVDTSTGIRVLICLLNRLLVILSD